MDLEELIQKEQRILKYSEGCYERAIKDIYLKLYKEKEYYLLQQRKSVHLPLQQLYNEVSEFRKSKSVSNIKTDYFFITINPDDEVSILSKFVRALETIMKKKWVEDLVYVIEQRGDNEDEIGKGYHCHMLINRNGKSFSKLNREILNTLYSHNIFIKRKLEDFNKPRNEDEAIYFIPYQKGPYVVEYTEPENIKNRLSYMLGNKVTVDKNGVYNKKDIKQQYDIPFRKKNNLKDYYQKGDIFTQYIEELHKTSPPRVILH